MIEVVAALIEDGCGRVLLVRKRGTHAYMQPGGKREAGETDLVALARELREELGCEIVAGSAEFLGVFEASAANEAAETVRAAIYRVVLEGAVRPCAEIEEAVWLHPAAAGRHRLAPLTREHVLPLARGG